jgi:membrane peptidoglycan carboxypeptidase
LALPSPAISWIIGLTPWGYELPADSTLRTALTSCQIARYAGGEYVLCPHRLPADAFPKHLGDALIASEDRQFYEHDGIALLLGMLPAPNDRDPIRNPQAAIDSAVRVLERMVEQDKISHAAAQKAAHALAWRIENNRLTRGSALLTREETRPYRDLAVAEAARHGVDVGERYRLITHMDLQVQEWVVTATESIAGRY